MPITEGRRLSMAEEVFEERAAIFEYEAGYPRPIAEELAWKIAYPKTWQQEAERDFFEERAAIIEFEGNLSRFEAEHAAHRLLEVYRLQLLPPEERPVVQKRLFEHQGATAYG